MLRRIARQVQLCDPVAGVFTALILVGGGLSAMVLAIPLYAIAAFHKRKLAEIRARQTTQIGDNTRAAIEELRKEIVALRDTTTQYDVGFDNALHRLDDRVGNLEVRVSQVERPAPDQVSIRQA